MSARHSGFEQRFPTRAANTFLVDSEKSSLMLTLSIYQGSKKRRTGEEIA